MLDFSQDLFSHVFGIVVSKAVSVVDVFAYVCRLDLPGKITRWFSQCYVRGNVFKFW